MSRITKLIVVVGPTASGKSELAVRLAKKFNGEVISADSRQIYRDLDIGSGKIAGKWIKSGKKQRTFIYKGVTHHCIDLVSPKKIYTVARYKTCAEGAIRDIAERRKLPILAGGTGFWIDAVVYGMHLPAVPPDARLRKKLAEKSPAELLRILKKMDPARARTVEQKNPRRIIRAIEVAQILGQTPRVKKRKPYRTLWIGIAPPQSSWLRKMTKRVEKMIRDGVVTETKKLRATGVSIKRIAEFGFEYRAALKYAEGKIGKKELLARIISGTKDYARRQMVWFRGSKEIRWIKGVHTASRMTKNFIGRRAV